MFLSGPQESHFGDPNDSQMVKNRTFLIRGGPEVPPGAPEASWTAYTAADCTLPPGTLGNTWGGSAPAPGPGETTFTYYFLPLSLYLLASNMWFLVDPHAAALVPRGRRIREACGHFRRPQKPLSEHTEYPKSRSMGLFWNLNRAPVTTFAPVRAGKAEKCDPSEPAQANRTPRGPPGDPKSTPAPLPLEYF